MGATPFIRLLIFVVLLCSACRRESPPNYDSSRTYELYGDSFFLDSTVPVQAVAAEPDVYLGHALNVEGKVQQVSGTTVTWLRLDTGNSSIVRIIVPTPQDGQMAFKVPDDVINRRVIVHGVLRKVLSSNTIGMSDSEVARIDNDGSSPSTRSVVEFQVLADGILMEKTRV